MFKWLKKRKKRIAWIVLGVVSVAAVVLTGGAALGLIPAAALVASSGAGMGILATGVVGVGVSGYQVARDVTRGKQAQERVERQVSTEAGIEMTQPATERSRKIVQSQQDSMEKQLNAFRAQLKAHRAYMEMHIERPFESVREDIAAMRSIYDGSQAVDVPSIQASHEVYGQALVDINEEEQSIIQDLDAIFRPGADVVPEETIKLLEGRFTGLVTQRIGLKGTLGNLMLERGKGLDALGLEHKAPHTVDKIHGAGAGAAAGAGRGTGATLALPGEDSIPTISSSLLMSHAVKREEAADAGRVLYSQRAEEDDAEMMEALIGNKKYAQSGLTHRHFGPRK